jgi:hypothetical protein
MSLAGMPLKFSKLSIRPQTPGFAPIPDRERETVRGGLFERLITRPSYGMPAQSVHGRIIQYDFGGLSLGIQYMRKSDLLHCEDFELVPLADFDLADAWYPTPELGVLRSGSSSRSGREEDICTQTHVAGNGAHISHSDLVDMKSVSKRSLQTRLKNARCALYSARVNNLCPGVTQSDGMVKVEMLEMTEKIADWAQAHEPRLRALHALLRKLLHEVANSRTGICLLRPLTATADICKRHWELYELEEDDPMLGSSVEIYRAMFSSF